MKIENIKKWTEICSIALKTKEKQVTYNKNIFEFRLFEFDNKKVGYMTIWNKSNKQAFHISRMKIDDSIKTKAIKIDNKENINNIYGIPDDLIFNNSKPY